MLGSKILPQGMGHTTCCFLQVEGGSEDDRHFTMEADPEKKFPVKELQVVGHALGGGSSSLGKDSLIRISYPKSASKLLQNDVVIVDRFSAFYDTTFFFDGKSTYFQPWRGLEPRIRQLDRQALLGRRCVCAGLQFGGHFDTGGS
jgi:hypothetical protein